MFNFFKKFPLGLDISDFSIEALELERKLGKLYLGAYSRVILEKGIIEDGKILNKEKIKEKFSELLNSAQPRSFRTKKVILSLPESKTFFDIFELPANLQGQQLHKAAEKEAEKTIPLLPQELYFDLKLISEKKDIKEVLYVGILKEIVDSYLEILREVDLIPLALDIESASLSRTFKSEKVADGGMLIIDIGARTTVLSLFDKDAIRLSSIVPTAGNHFTKEIAGKLNVSLKEAEELKKKCGLDDEKGGGRVMFILQDVLNDILDEAKNFIRFYEQKEKRGVKKVVLCGGSSLIPKIVSYFSSNLGIETKIGNPSLICPDLDNIKIESGKVHPVLFSNVVGLALRGLEKDPESSGINLIPAEERHKVVPIGRKLKKNKFSNFFVAVLFLLIVFSLGWMVYNYILKPPLVETEIETPIVKEEPLPEEEEMPEEIPLPSALIPVQEIEILEIRERSEILQALNQILEKELEEGIYLRILIKDLRENRFLGLKEFFTTINVKLPDDFYSSLNNEFTLFVFSQKEGKRLGFVTRIIKEGFEDILRDLEPTMEEDFNSLFILMNKKDPTLVPYFKDSSYQGTAIRYQTFSRQDLGICYSLFEDYFVFTSSFRGIKTTLDGLGIK